MTDDYEDDDFCNTFVIKHFLSLGFESGSNAEGPGSNSSFTYIVVIYTIYYLHNKYWDFYYTYNKCNSSIRNGFEAAARTTFTFKSSFEAVLFDA